LTAAPSDESGTTAAPSEEAGISLYSHGADEEQQRRVLAKGSKVSEQKKKILVTVCVGLNNLRLNHR
jgi:hypothetical protein